MEEAFLSNKPSTALTILSMFPFPTVHSLRLSKKKPTSEMTFGYARAEVLGGLVNATFLLGICLTMFFEGIERLVETEPIKQPKAFLIVGGIGLLVNILGMFIFHDHSHSDNLQGVFLHVMGDFFGSIAVVISACVVQFSDWKYKDYVDPVLSLLIVIILVGGTQKLFRKTAKQVLERCPEEVDLDEVKADLASGKTTRNTVGFHILKREKTTDMIAIFFGQPLLIPNTIKFPTLQKPLRLGTQNAGNPITMADKKKATILLANANAVVNQRRRSVLAPSIHIARPKPVQRSIHPKSMTPVK